eukprot:TRINITY_DN886_c0_g1_i1.p1 TRINITY_DN886_c0_g1~~TRINITY_DN886_c0_g1_i1.p1  ORF type:complete len:55 (+),score=1.83 TRINITY_DN886_c0_g1_i1:76-240(+)
MTVLEICLFVVASAFAVCDRVSVFCIKQRTRERGAGPGREHQLKYKRAKDRMNE